MNTKLKTFICFFLTVLGKGHITTFLFIDQWDGSVMTSSFFLNKEKNELANVSCYLILYYVVFHVPTNLLMNLEAV